MAETSLISYELLASPSFAQDLRSFLNLSEEVLLAISELGNNPDGFRGQEQAQSLSSRFDIRSDRVIRDLRVAEYLYNRFADSEMNVEEALDEISSVASQWDEPVELDDQRRDALRDMLSLKREYEVSKAVKGGTTGSAPHFVRLAGAWAIRPVRVRSEDPIMAPILTMSIVWHDGSGNQHEAYFHMGDDDWSELQKEIKSLAESRTELEPLLK